MTSATSDNVWLCPTAIGPSPIHGYGRFAACDIPAGTAVGILRGDVIAKDGEHLPIKGTEYCVACPNTMINHSSEANLSLDGQILLRATRTIASGTELTLDYRQLTTTRFDFID